MKVAKPKKKLPQDLRVANCADCGAIVVSVRKVASNYGLSELAKRIEGRPFCRACVNLRKHAIDSEGLAS